MASARQRLLERVDWILIAVLVCLYLWRFVLPVLTDSKAPRADDFQDYLYATRAILQGANLYADFVRTHVPWDWSLSSGYLYPPAFALLLVPLAWVSNDLATRIWLLLIQAAVLLSLLIVYRVLGRPRRRELLLMTAVVTTFFPLASTVWTGAMNAVLLLMLTGAWALWQRERDVLSGILLGAAAVFKVFPLALSPFLAFRRHWRLCLALGLTGIAGILLGLLVTGWENNFYYFRDMLPHLAAGTGYRENQSLSGFAARLCDPGTADRGGSAAWCGRLVAWPLELAVLGVLLTAVRRDRRRPEEFALAVAALPLLSSVTWSFHLVLLLFPIAILVRAVCQAAVPSGQMRLLGLAWFCFAMAPVIHYLLVLHPLQAAGFAAWLAAAVTRFFGETYLLGTVIVFGVLWVKVRDEKAAQAWPAELAA